MSRKNVIPKEILEQQPRYDGRFGCKYDEPLTKQPFGARLPESIAAKIQALPNRSEWIREVLIEAAERLPDVPESN